MTLIHQFDVTDADIRCSTDPTCVLSLQTGRATISSEYIINSFSRGQVTVQYNVTPDGGSATGWTDATVENNEITSGVYLQAKNRQIKKSLTWEFHKDVLPVSYEACLIKLIFADSNDATEEKIIDMDDGLDFTPTIINLKSYKFGTDTTPTFQFNMPKVLTTINMRPVLEYGTDADLSTIDHTVTAYHIWNEVTEEWDSGDAINGETVSPSGAVKCQMTATTAMSGTEFFRVRLMPVSFMVI